MLRCKQIVEITSKNTNMTFLKKVEYKIHLLMCKHCSSYVEQLRLMNLQYKKIFLKIGKIHDGHLIELEKKIIDEVIKNK